MATYLPFFMMLFIIKPRIIFYLIFIDGELEGK